MNLRRLAAIERRYFVRACAPGGRQQDATHRSKRSMRDKSQDWHWQRRQRSIFTAETNVQIEWGGWASSSFSFVFQQILLLYPSITHVGPRLQVSLDTYLSLMRGHDQLSNDRSSSHRSIPSDGGVCQNNGFTLVFTQKH